ncbi:hypothetical protein CR513_01915, partial [Mucuna pruriens]
MSFLLPLNSISGLENRVRIHKVFLLLMEEDGSQECIQVASLYSPSLVENSIEAVSCATLISLQIYLVLKMLPMLTLQAFLGEKKVGRTQAAFINCPEGQYLHLNCHRDSLQEQTGGVPFPGIYFVCFATSTVCLNLSFRIHFILSKYRLDYLGSCLKVAESGENIQSCLRSRMMLFRMLIETSKFFKRQQTTIISRFMRLQINIQIYSENIFREIFAGQSTRVSLM